MKRLVVALVVLFLVFGLVPWLVVERGDWMGPLERLARAMMQGWDMWAVESVRAYERPMPGRPEGAVPVSGRAGYEQGVRAIAALDPSQARERGRVVFARLCDHCHGPQGDGRVIVGESFDVSLPDLRSSEVQGRSDRALFGSVFYGTGNMIPLRETVSPDDLLLALQHVRSLAGAPSRPYFERKGFE